METKDIWYLDSVVTQPEAENVRHESNYSIHSHRPQVQCVQSALWKNGALCSDAHSTESLLPSARAGRLELGLDLNVHRGLRLPTPWPTLQKTGAQRLLFSCLNLRLRSLVLRQVPSMVHTAGGPRKAVQAGSISPHCILPVLSTLHTHGPSRTCHTVSRLSVFWFVSLCLKHSCLALHMADSFLLIRSQLNIFTQVLRQNFPEVHLHPPPPDGSVTPLYWFSSQHLPHSRFNAFSLLLRYDIHTVKPIKCTNLKYMA